MSRRRHGPGNLARVLPAIDLDAPPSAHPGPVDLLRADELPGLAPALPNEDAALVHAQRGARAREALRAELETVYAQQDPDLVALRASLRPRGRD